MGKSEKFYLSYSKISTYIKCPLRYKFIYVDNLETEIKPYFSFGNSIHKVLEKFYSPEENFKVLKKDPYKYLLELLDKHWISAGYKNVQEELSAKNEAKEILIAYYRENIFGFEPAFEVESEFSIPFLGLDLKGRLDRVDKVNKDFIIIDYKTNNFLSDSFREDEILQPVIYKIAGDYKYGKNIKEISFHYLRKGKKVNFEVSSYLIEKSKKRIGEIVENIYKGYFQPNVNKSCSTCEFKDRCEAYALVQLSRKSL
ncbi:RecB family exonuclease [Caldisericum sp.]|jgi:RecB family exonuclease|uniref:RecB family exonuclease n=1 Tax=Caldisericum sp. TaxID=2499687 RepID=UPI003D1500DF